VHRKDGNENRPQLVRDVARSCSEKVDLSHTAATDSRPEQRHRLELLA
jgi:hypothetical protein